MPSLPIAFSSSDLHLDAELLQRLDPIGELDRKEDVRRLVDQIAGQLDAFGDGEAVLRGRPRGGGMARADDEIGRLGAVVLRVLLARLVFVESVAAQPKAEREIGGRPGRPRVPAGASKATSTRFAPASLPKMKPPSVMKSIGALSLPGATPTTRSRDASRPAGARMSSAVRWAARKLDALAAARMSGSRSPNCSRHSGRRLHVGPDEHDERAAFRARTESQRRS